MPLQIVITCWIVLLSSFAIADDPFDVLIRSGQIVDGTGNPWFHADVAIRADRIVAIGKLVDATAKTVIDARGKVVAPGFIDIHSHSDLLLLEDGNAPSKIRQGVTTEVLGEGSSAGPSRTGRFKRLGDYFDEIERADVAVNVASYVGLNNVWQGVMGSSFDRPTSDQITQMKVILDEAMSDGACGLSSMLAMPPGSLTTTDDIVDLCSVVARHGGIYSTHNRNEGTGIFDAVKEAIEIGERAGVPVDIIHLKIADQKCWGRMADVIELIEAARGRGVNVQANVYPYTRGNNNLASIIPPWAHEGGTLKLIERLNDATLRPRLKHEIREGLPGWYNHFTAVGGDWSRMLVSGKGGYEGLTLDRIITTRTQGKDVDSLDELFDILIEHGGSVPTVYAHHTEDDMNLAMRQPWCSIGSDGSAYAIDGPLRRGNPHPRNFGTFPRVLGVYVRERNVLRLEDAIRKMTSLNAERLSLVDRGVLRPGGFADVTVFDAQRVIDKSTYNAPFQYSEGIEHVIVNGRVVLSNGQPTGAQPGHALRRLPAHEDR
ncbi:MAG: D-aminoacylase [Planctomycetota bacterium]|nr:D-aminoacylase [Planctomycetota bacterium]